MHLLDKSTITRLFLQYWQSGVYYNVGMAIAIIALCIKATPCVGIELAYQYLLFINVFNVTYLERISTVVIVLPTIYKH